MCIRDRCCQWYCVVEHCDVKDYGGPTTPPDVVTYDYNSNVVLVHSQSSKSFQHPTKRKSPSIFSSVEELARGSGATQLMPPSPDLLPAFDLSTDSGYADNTFRDVTSGFDRAAVSMATDDVITTPIDRATAFRPVLAAAVPVSRNRSISGSGFGAVASGTTTSEKPPHPREGELSTLLAVGMETASSPRLQKQQSLIPCLLYTSPSPRDRQKSRMPSSA